MISGAVIKVDHLEAIREAEQAFGVPNEEITVGIQATIELIDQPLLFCLVEIDHHVAAEDEVIALRQELSFQVMEVELDQFPHIFFDLVNFADLVEVPQAVHVVDRLHLLLGVAAFLRSAQRGVADIGGNDFYAPWWRDRRLRRRHVKRQRVAQVVIRKRIANLHCQRVWLLPGGTASTPNAQSPVAAILFLVEHFFQDGLLEQFELRLVAKKTGFVDGENF